MKKVFIFVPAFGHQISSTTVQSIVGIMQAFNAAGIGGGFATLSFPDIAELRNMALSIFYDAVDATHMLFLDADMGIDPSMVLEMLNFDEPVVGCLYPKKTLPIEWAGSGTGEAQAECRGYYMHVQGVGFGCTLIRRDAVRIMLEKYPEAIDTRLEHHIARQMLVSSGAKRVLRLFDCLDDPATGKVSEDLSFCRRWNACGGKVWASIGHNVCHMGLYPYTAKYLDLLNNPAAQPPQPLPVAVATVEAPKLQAAE